MNKLITYFSATQDQITGLVALLIVCAMFLMIGMLIRPQRYMPEIDLIAGWSLVTLVFVVAGGLGGINFQIITSVLVLTAILSFLVMLRKKWADRHIDLIKSLVLALPLLWLTATMAISQWDEFTHWIPNARYLYTYDSLPGPGKPEPTSNLPGYPHTLAFVIYLVSKVTGGLAENASAIFTVVLLALFSVTLGRVAKQTANEDQGPKIGWSFCAIGALAITVLNPTFVPKIVFTAYADTPTMVLIGMLTVLMWRILNALAGTEKHCSAGPLSWSFGLVAMAAVGTKQPNIVLCCLITLAGLVVVLKDPKISLRSYLRLLPAIILPSMVIYFAWQLHIDYNHVDGEFNFLPIENWNINKIDVIAEKMLLIATKKGGYFSVMIIACLFGARALWRLRTPFDRLSIVTAVLFAGYILFLLFVYTSAFGGNGLVAPSFWRFNMHLGGACVVFATVCTALIWRRFFAIRQRMNLAWLAIALILCAPLALAYKIRFDLHPPKIYVRTVMEKVVELVPRGSPFIVFDVTGNGEFEVIARYVASPHVDYRGFFTAGYVPTVQNLQKYVRVKQPEYIWIHVPTAEVQDALNVGLKPHHSHLVKMRGLQATILRAWPFPGYKDPNTIQN